MNILYMAILQYEILVMEWRKILFFIVDSVNTNG